MTFLSFPFYFSIDLSFHFFSLPIFSRGFQSFPQPLFQSFLLFHQPSNPFYKLMFLSTFPFIFCFLIFLDALSSYFLLLFSLQFPIFLAVLSVFSSIFLLPDVTERSSITLFLLWKCLFSSPTFHSQPLHAFNISQRYVFYLYLVIYFPFSDFL